MFPENCKIYIDGKDRTAWIFGADTITPTLEKFSWSNIDITQFVRSKGKHIIQIIPESGVGRVEVVVEFL